MTNAAPTPSGDRARAWNACLTAAPGALDLRVSADAIQGAVPPALFGGRLLSNGPGWNVIGGVNLHPFDGHGYVRSFRFRPDGSIQLTARYVETPSFLAESEAGRLVHRGFATNLDGSFLRNIGFGVARNVANTTIVRWGPRLLAGWEAGSPYALDPATLATRGEEHFGGLIEGEATLAHMKHEARTGRLLLCGIAQGRDTTLTFRELERNDSLASEQRFTLAGSLFVHDFAVTPSWYVLGGNPLRLKLGELARMLIGRSTMLRSIDIDPAAQPALHLLPRGGGAPRTVRLPDPSWVVHFGNAFERGDDVIVHASVFHHFAFGEEFGYAGPDRPFDPGLPDARGPQRLYRITIPAGSDEATWEQICPHGVDFLRFHPAHEGLDTPALFGATRADTRFSDPFDAIIRLDLRDLERPPSIWSAPGAFVGEPIFAPDPEDPAAGHLLVIVSRGLEERSELVVLDAADPTSGPLAVAPLPLLPVAFHGEWEGAPQ